MAEFAEAQPPVEVAPVEVAPCSWRWTLLPLGRFIMPSVSFQKRDMRSWAPLLGGSGYSNCNPSVRETYSPNVALFGDLLGLPVGHKYIAPDSSLISRSKKQPCGECRRGG